MKTVKTPKPKYTFIYKGPIFHFEHHLGTWYGTTVAVSKKQAISFLTHQYKVQHGLAMNNKIELDEAKLKQGPRQMDWKTICKGGDFND